MSQEISDLFPEDGSQDNDGDGDVSLTKFDPFLGRENSEAGDTLLYQCP